MQTNWWEIHPETLIDTPFLAIYTNRIRHNIEHLIDLANGNCHKLRPHIKTHKLGEILFLFKTYQINKIKCATIAEAELAAINEINDILLAYQPTGLKKQRWIVLIKKYPTTQFSTIVDNLKTAQELNQLAQENQLKLNIYLDLNTGMNRTGANVYGKWNQLVDEIILLKNLNFLGIHIYDGQIKGSLESRNQEVSKLFEIVTSKLALSEEKWNCNFKIIAGGSNTFPFYATLPNVEPSPGTFVFWDVNYQTNLPEQDFKTAAVVVGTIISKPTVNTLCIDIGYKSVASENPIDKRLTILNDENLIPISHSEEHLVLENKGSNQYTIGQNIYALPYHICPTCALYESVQVVNAQHYIFDEWQVLARNKKITI